MAETLVGVHTHTHTHTHSILLNNKSQEVVTTTFIKDIVNQDR